MANDRIKPATIPDKAIPSAFPSTRLSRSARAAPSAMRTPISRDRCVTVYDITPYTQYRPTPARAWRDANQPGAEARLRYRFVQHAFHGRHVYERHLGIELTHLSADRPRQTGWICGRTDRNENAPSQELQERRVELYVWEIELRLLRSSSPFSSHRPQCRRPCAAARPLPGVCRSGSSAAIRFRHRFRNDRDRLALSESCSSKSRPRRSGMRIEAKYCGLTHCTCAIRDSPLREGCPSISTPLPQP